MNRNIKRRIPVIGTVGMLFVLLMGIRYWFDVESASENCGDLFLKPGYILLFLFLLAFLILTGFLTLKKEIRPERSFFLTGLFLGLFFMAVMPGLSAPDEISHYITSYRLSNRIMGQRELEPESGQIEIRSDDYPLEDLKRQRNTEAGTTSAKTSVLGYPVEESTYHTILNWDKLYPHTDGNTFSRQADVRTTPLVYIPQALGMSLARLLNLNALWLLFFGKLFSLLAYLFLTYFAIKKIPFGKELIYGTALLPMTASISSSLSYDTIILGTAFLLTAWFLDLAYGRAESGSASGERGKTVRIRDIVILCVLLMVLGPCKLVYSPLLLLFFLIPKQSFKNKGARVLSFAVLLFSLGFSMYLVNASIIHSYASASAGSAVVQNTKAGFTVSELLHRPGLILQMLCNTIVYQAEQIHLSMMGEWLGNLDLVMGIPYFLSILFSLGLLGLAFKKPGEVRQMKKDARVWTWLILIGIFLLMAGAMLVAWTERNSKVIEGIQGRYFLPVLPLFLILLKNDSVVLTSDRNREILFGFVCMDAYALLRLFATACLRL